MNNHQTQLIFALILSGILLQPFLVVSIPVHASTDDVVIISHYHSYYLHPTYQDWYSYIVGEVQNQGSDNVLFVGVTGTFFDSNDNILATDFEYVEIDVLEPGQSSPFLLQSWLPNVPADHYTVTISRYDVTTETLYREFQIHNDALLYPKSNDYNPYVEGDVENTGQSHVNKCKVLVTLYDAEGTAISTDYHIIMDMPAGSTRSFNFWFGSTPEISSYQIQVTTFAFNRRITCTVASPTVPLGSNITVFGALIPPRAADTVTLNYTSPEGTLILRNVTTSSDGYGQYNDTYAPPRVGVWSVHAIWDGDATYAGAASSTQTFNITKLPTDLSGSLSTTTIAQGQAVNVTVCVQPIYNTTIQITYHRDTEWTNLTTFNTTHDPCYVYTWSPPHVGTYQLNVTCLGDATHQAATDGVTLHVKQPSVLSYQVDANIALGETLIISGTLIPALAETTIFVNYTKPGGQVITQEVQTSEEGSFTKALIPDVVGVWTVSLGWPGNDEYAGDVSQQSFMVAESPISPISIMAIIAVIVVGVLAFIQRHKITGFFRN